jgi:hypothetical protein
MPAHVILFENADFQGNHKHCFDHIENLSTQVDHYNFNDKTSSLVVVEGYWQFFKDWMWQNPWPRIVGPGAYATMVEALGASDTNDTVTGLRPVDSLGNPLSVTRVSQKQTA